MNKLLLFLTAITLTASAFGQESKEAKKMDGKVEACYLRCRDHLRKPEVVAMCDTLFQLARQEGDLDTQGTAMVFTVDYYYSMNDLDSLQVWMDRIGRFAAENKMPKPYYFAWNKLISLHIKNTKYTLAQYEIEKQIRQAKQDGYKFGVAIAYCSLGNIYLLRGVASSAAKYYCKAANYILDNDLERYTLTNIYSQMSNAYTSLGQYPEAFKALDNAEKYTTNEGVKYMIDGDRAKLHAKMGNTAKALALLRKIEVDKPAFFPPAQLEELRADVYKSCKMYPEAIKAINALIEIHKQTGSGEVYYSDVIESRAQIFASMGNMEQAYDDLKHFVTIYKNKVSKEGESTLAEFATLMGVEQLNQEKAKLEEQAQAERFQRTRILLAALIAILSLATIFIAIQLRQNRKLRHAKSTAEEANRMKGEFIRNITHEVNTPLNAVLGFAELAIGSPSDDPERQGYIDIVHENSDYLQKLIDDTLYIADLESTNEAPACEQVDLCNCCRHSLNNVVHLHKAGVEILFHPEQETIPAYIPAQYVIKTTTELLRNALTFTTKGTITLSVGYTPDHLNFQITVTDTGCGVPSSESEHIFERFIKLNSFSHGMGIGLSVCRMIAQHMNATLQHDPTYTAGARFVFTFEDSKT